MMSPAPSTPLRKVRACRTLLEKALQEPQVGGRLVEQLRRAQAAEAGFSFVLTVKGDDPVVSQSSEVAHELRQGGLTVGERAILPSPAELAVLVPAVGQPSEILHAHQRQPRGDEVQTHLP